MTNDLDTIRRGPATELPWVASCLLDPYRWDVTSRDVPQLRQHATHATYQAAWVAELDESSRDDSAGLEQDAVYIAACCNAAQALLARAESGERMLADAEAELRNAVNRAEAAEAQLDAHSELMARRWCDAKIVEDERDRLLALLRRLEWCLPGDVQDDWCPVCTKHISQGHSTNCELAAALKR